MRPAKPYTIEQFYDTFSIINSSFSHDEQSILYTSSQTGTFNAFTVPVTGGPPQQLTYSTSRAVYAVSYFPHDSRILFVRDRNGDENHHLYVSEANGTQKDLTRGKNVKAKFLGWTHDGNYFYFQTNERDARFFDIYKMEISGFTRTLIFRDTEGFRFHSVSKDENYIVFAKGAGQSDSDIFLYNLASMELKHLTPHSGQIAFAPAAFDVNSQSLYYLTDEDSEFSYVACVELSTGKRSVVYKAPGKVFAFLISHNGKYRIILIDEDGRKRIKIYDHRTGIPIALPIFPEADITSATISKSERLMAFYVNSDRHPSSLWVYNFAAGQARRLVSSLNPEIDPNDLVDARRVSYFSFDGLEIPAFLWKPHEASVENKVPALIWLHGGPGGQTRKGYSPRIQYLVNHGYAVLGVNYRGSSGYGKTFLAADDHKHGREPLWDCIESKKYLASLGYIKTDKIGVIGASFGGYMVLAALAFAPEEFAAGVDLFGISNWIRMIQSFPPYWTPHLQFYYRKLGDPRTEPDKLRALSPLFHADKITKPLMIVQGANDPRVLRVEADEMVEAIRKRNGIVDYLVFEDEGHGLTKRANRIVTYDSVVKFFDRHLKGVE